MINLKRVCVVGHKEGAANRGAFTVSKRFAQQLGFDFRNDSSIKNILNETRNYDKFILTHQQPVSYQFRFNFLVALQLDCLVYTRFREQALIYNSASNGFSFYKNMKCHKNFIPEITDFSILHTSVSEITIGFYCRSHITPDATLLCKDELEKTKGLHLVTCGNKKELFKNVASHYHTTDTDDFFSRITHYYFPQSAIFVDPFPNMLLEAIQLGKQIISPKLYKRKHVDGIDDILSMISGYHDSIESAVRSDKYYDNRNHGITFDNFKHFYSKVIANNFSYSLPYDKYKSWYDWCSHEL